MAERTISHYELQRLLGEGAMGKVYLARDVILDRPVAIKLITPRNLGDPSFFDRFKREARLAGQLNHPNVATVYEYGEEGGEAFLAMEFVDGTTLSDTWKAGPLAVELVRKWGAQAAAALGAAHKRGIVHRDIKGPNLMITADGDLKVMDFGVARSSSETQLTMDGQLIGTANIMAPEIVQGGQAVSQSDLFSLGCVLYEALAGVAPFPGDDAMSVLYQVVHQEPRNLSEIRPDVPPDLAALIHGMLSKDPSGRPGPAELIADALLGKPVDFSPADAGATMVQGGDVTMVAGPPPGTGFTPVPPTGNAPPPGTQTAPPGTAVGSQVGVPPVPPANRKSWWIPLVLAVGVALAGMWYFMGRSGDGVSGNRAVAVSFNEEAVRLIDANRDSLMVRPDVADEIIDLLIKSTNADPKYVDAWNNMGIVFLESGKTHMAESHIRRGLEENPDNHVLYIHLAEVLAANGSPQAENNYRKAIQLNPNLIYRNNFGSWLIEQERFDEALEELEVAWTPFATGSIPDSLRHIALAVRKNKGLAQLGLNDLDGAESTLAGLTDFAPRYLPGWMAFARVAEARGDLKEAGKRWARLVSATIPGSPSFDPELKAAWDAWEIRRNASQDN